jgi:hypothetical protein
VYKDISLNKSEPYYTFVMKSIIYFGVTTTTCFPQVSPKYMNILLNIAFLLLYWFNCLSETDCWQNSIDSKGLDFILKTAEIMQCIANNMCIPMYLQIWNDVFQGQKNVNLQDLIQQLVYAWIFFWNQLNTCTTFLY